MKYKKTTKTNRVHEPYQNMGHIKKIYIKDSTYCLSLIESLQCYPTFYIKYDKATNATNIYIYRYVHKPFEVTLETIGRVFYANLLCVSHVLIKFMDSY